MSSPWAPRRQAPHARRLWAWGRRVWIRDGGLCPGTIEPGSCSRTQPLPCPATWCHTGIHSVPWATSSPRCLGQPCERCRCPVRNRPTGTGATSREHPHPGQVPGGLAQEPWQGAAQGLGLGVACRGSWLRWSHQGGGIPRWGFRPQRGAREKSHSHLPPLERRLWADGPEVRSTATPAVLARRRGAGSADVTAGEARLRQAEQAQWARPVPAPPLCSRAPGGRPAWGPGDTVGGPLPGGLPVSAIRSFPADGGLLDKGGHVPEPGLIFSTFPRVHQFFLLSKC